MENTEEKYINRTFGQESSRVGQAVHDILAKEQPSYTVEDILSEYGKDYCTELENTIEANKKKYTSPFYVFTLMKKEFYANNVVRNFFIARQTPPHASDMMQQYPHFVKTLYIVDYEKGKIRLVWNLPGIEDCKTIMNHPELYDEQLCNWVLDCFGASLNKDSYPVDLPS